MLMLFLSFLFFSALLFGKDEKIRESKHIGSINPSCKVKDVILDASENARFLCDQYYLASPEVVVTEHNGNEIFEYLP